MEFYIGKMKTLSKQDYNNIKKIIENDEKVGGSKNNLKVLLYSIFVCIFNRYMRPGEEEVYIINGRAECKYINRQNSKPLFYGVFSKKISDICFSLMHVSYIKRGRRLAIICKGLFSKCNGHPKGYIIDYLLWKDFFEVYVPEKIGGSGHYDRLTTQVALLSQMNKKKYYMKQHGLIGNNMNLPNKIPVYSIVAFDEIEISKFKKEVVLNSDCIYTTEYVSSVEFVNTEMNHKHIGIIDTPIKEMNELVDRIITSVEDVECTVMLHPLSNLNSNYAWREKVKFTCSKQKEISYNLLVSGPSTLVYDYVRAGYVEPIFVYVLDVNSGLCDLAQKYQNVVICYSIDELLELVEKKINGEN